jgi:hypothetical protein
MSAFLSKLMNITKVSGIIFDVLSSYANYFDTMGTSLLLHVQAKKKYFLL